MSLEIKNMLYKRTERPRKYLFVQPIYFLQMTLSNSTWAPKVRTKMCSDFQSQLERWQVVVCVPTRFFVMTRNGVLCLFRSLMFQDVTTEVSSS